MIESLLNTSTYVFLSFLIGSFLLYKYFSEGSTVALIHSGVLFWSGTIYTNFLFEYFPVGRTYYIDWIVSTPLIVLAFGYTLTGGLGKKVVQSSLLQAGVIGTGFMAFNTSQTVLWFGLGTVLMLKVFYNFVQLGAVRLQPVLFTVFAGTFSLYPVVWFETGGSLVEASTALLVLPFVSKHVFSLMDVYLSN
jgi:bacteriorhodopsin